MEEVLRVEHVNKEYKTGNMTFQALKDINLCLHRGESLAIVGKSGSGKSTLMHILATLDKPTSGEVMVLGRETTHLSAGQISQLRNKVFGFVFQQFFINPRSSCLDNVTLPLTIGGMPPAQRKKEGLAMLEAVGLGDRAQQKANDLSGGQKQRLCIARALINHPEVIFADEPTGNLDTENGERVMNLLFQLQKEQNITLVVVTHDEDIAKMCQRQITIKDGQIVEGGGVCESPTWWQRLTGI
jgi:putative ABC transport system ATP-binding protein